MRKHAGDAGRLREGFRKDARMSAFTAGYRDLDRTPTRRLQRLDEWGRRRLDECASTFGSPRVCIRHRGAGHTLMQPLWRIQRDDGTGIVARGPSEQRVGGPADVIA